MEREREKKVDLLKMNWFKASNEKKKTSLDGENILRVYSKVRYKSCMIAFVLLCAADAN